MELLFLAILMVLMAGALASGFPVAFALPGSAIITILLAAGSGYIFAGDVDAFFSQGGPSNWLSAGVTNFRGIYWEVERDTLIAIPLFVFMGIMLQRSKIAEDLLISMAQLFGPIRGGLGISVVFVGALLAATTGIVGATVVAMGLISLPAMMRNNYSNWLSTGTIAASGTLGQIIPPSIVLIILADQLSNAVDQAGAQRAAMYKESTGEFSMPSEFGVTSTSAGDMFMGALVPGLVLVGLYMLFIFVMAFWRKDIAPPVPFDGEYDRRFAAKVLIALVPPLALIFVVLGSIIAGVATVNQAGAIGAAGALVMASYRLYEGEKGAYYPAVVSGVSVLAIMILSTNFDINVRAINTTTDAVVVFIASIAVIGFIIGIGWSGYRALKIDNTMKAVLMDTAKTTSLVFIILLGAAMLTSAFRAFGGEHLVRDFLHGLPGGFWTQFIIVMVVIFVLGFFLDFIEIAVVVVPIVAPILLADPSANITAVWLGVMIGLNIQTSFLTPPFGFALFYLRGVAPPAVKTIQMYKGVIPFISLQILALVIVGNYPAMVNYLPTRISLLSETAPPPKNPRLQACVQDYISQRFDTDGDTIRAAIAKAQGLDTGNLPRGIQRDLSKALDLAGKSFDAKSEAAARSEDVQAEAVAYQPVQREVGVILSDIADIAEELKLVSRDLDRLQRNNPDRVDQIQSMVEQVADLEQRKAAAEALVPDSWDKQHKDFLKLLAEEKKAYNAFRRTVDNAYGPVVELIATIEGGDALSALRAEIDGLSGVIQGGDAEAAQEAIKAMESRLGGIANAGDVRSALSKARRALRTRGSSEPNPEKAMEELGKTLAALDEETVWRKEASGTLLSGLVEYEAAIRDTIGLRQLDRFPREIALQVASCRSDHKDISLHF